MSADLEHLIATAGYGNYDDFLTLVSALRADPGAEARCLIDLVHSPEPILRRAAILGARGRTEPELVAAIHELVYDDCSPVRRQLAEALEEEPSWSLPTTLAVLLHDEDSDVRLVAVRAAWCRPSFARDLIGRLSADESWRVRQEIARLFSSGEPAAVLPALLTRLAEDGDIDVQHACAASLEEQLARLGGYPGEVPRPAAPVLEEARRRVAGFNNDRQRLLAAWLAERAAMDVDVDLLRTFGTLLTAEAEAARLPRAHGVDQACRAVMTVLTGTPPRAAVLLGEPGTGKTAVVFELAHRLRREASFHILRVSPGDFLTGTTYVGEWQTKLHNLIQAVRYPKPVILYIPNLQELAGVGTTSKSDLNVATMLAPYLERGEVAILGESTPEAFRTGLGILAPVRRLFHAIELPAADLAQTRNILQAVRDEARAEVPDPVLDRLGELADYYLSGSAQPGRTVGLLRRVLNVTAGRPGSITPRDVLVTLSTSTGIPVDFLDDNVPLDRAQVRAFFEARVMGQSEAVDAVVDLVTLVKAGLTDPGKPFGVMLFVGPTGVGKTELARALAELLFGDPGRMIRLDMSEFATPEAFERLIGWGTRPGLLTAPVRERPFAVVLLDEIEKSHLNIFDLCLQIFDAGRLTDTQGRTTDFRKTIIVLTSNVGSGSVVREAPVGFGRDAPPPPDRETTLRELGRWFRPEFLNRIDRIVTFQPLAVETAEKIARREVSRVLERSGIARRRLAVDVEPGVIPLLLREGYSLAFGARPLKRTVERLVLLPVAQAIVSGSVSPGSVLRLIARGARVDVEVTPAEPTEDQESPPPAGVRAAPAAERVSALTQEMTVLSEQAAPLAARKSELLARAAEPGFWDARDRAQGVYDEIYRIDGIFGMLERLEKSVRIEAESSQQKRLSERDLVRLEERLAGLESQARHLAFLVSCRSGPDLGDTLLSLTLVKSHGAGLDAVGKLARMYVGLARRRGLEVDVLDDRQGGDPAEDTITLSITGAGAHALLVGEMGLHQLSRGHGERRDGRRRAVDRDVVRVEVLPAPAGAAAFGRDEVRVEHRPLKGKVGRLMARPKAEIQLLHLPSMTAVRAWTEASKAQAVEALQPLLRARVSAGGSGAKDPSGRLTFVRRYTLGPAPLVRDVRSGLTLGRLDQILEGHLDAFLSPPEAGSGA
jgi:ATP-dependent Clp protease ATP-binding subunit ClpC